MRLLARLEIERTKATEPIVALIRALEAATEHGSERAIDSRAGAGRREHAARRIQAIGRAAEAQLEPAHSQEVRCNEQKTAGPALRRIAVESAKFSDSRKL